MWKGQRAELLSYLHSVGATFLHRSHSFTCCRKENQCWNGELSRTTQCHQQTCDVEQSDVQWHQIEGVCTGWRGSGRGLSPEERRTTKRTAPIHDPEQKRSASFYSGMTQKTQKQCHEYQKHFLNGSAANKDERGLQSESGKGQVTQRIQMKKVSSLNQRKVRSDNEYRSNFDSKRFPVWNKQRPGQTTHAAVQMKRGLQSKSGKGRVTQQKQTKKVCCLNQRKVRSHIKYRWKGFGVWIRERSGHTLNVDEKVSQFKSGKGQVNT